MLPGVTGLGALIVVLPAARVVLMLHLRSLRRAHQSQWFFATNGTARHCFDRPQVSPALVAARTISEIAPRMWSSMIGLVVGGSATVHIRTYMSAPATAVIRRPMPRMSASPM